MIIELAFAEEVNQKGSTMPEILHALLKCGVYCAIKVACAIYLIAQLSSGK